MAVSGTLTLENLSTTEPAVEADPVALLATLHRCLDGLTGTGLRDLDPDALADHLAGLERASCRLGAAGMTALRVLDQRETWREVSAAYSAANWLVAETGTSRSDAAGRVRLARALGDMPLAAAALAAGEITAAHARVLARCLGPRTREAFASAEADLVGHARVLRADDFARAVRYWIELVDPDGPEPDGGGGPDSAHLSQSSSGRWLLGGEFGDEVGAELDAATKEKMDELYRRDRTNSEIDPTDPSALRPAAERRADAIAELIRKGAAAPDSAGRRRPAFTVLADLPTLADIFGPDRRHDRDGSPGGGGGDTDEGDATGASDRFAGVAHELLDGTVVSLDTLRLWACDASFSRVVFGPDSEPLDVGRLERYATDAQRRLLAARDRGCAVPSCDRPVAWTDAHHIHEWEVGGPTDIDNLVLLCRHHHRRVHRGHLEVRMVDHRPRFFLPDGREITYDRWQPPPPDST
jgi:hypothetical protein